MPGGTPKPDDGASVGVSRRGRILDSAYENTAYSEADLTRALVNRLVMLQGTLCGQIGD